MCLLDDPNIKIGIGLVLVSMHWIMFSGTMLVILLTNELPVIVLANMFLYLLLTMNIIFGDCPISIIEDYYLGTCMVDTMSSLTPYTYKLSERGNSTLQWLFMAIMVSTTKVILLLIKYTFQEFLESK